MLNFRFESPIPLNRGCIITIVFPSDFTVNEGMLTNVTGFGLFGGVR